MLTDTDWRGVELVDEEVEDSLAKDDLLLEDPEKNDLNADLGACNWGSCCLSAIECADARLEVVGEAGCSGSFLEWALNGDWSLPNSESLSSSMYLVLKWGWPKNCEFDLKNL